MEGIWADRDNPRGDLKTARPIARDKKNLSAVCGAENAFDTRKTAIRVRWDYDFSEVWSVAKGIGIECSKERRERK
jgi:hypothetical protein